MAQTSWPFESIDTSETQFSQWARNIGEGVIQNAGLELEPYADGSGMNVKVKSGQALVRGHYYNSTAEETLTITTADASLPRIDVVALRLDPTANTIVLVVLEGTPNASPVAPSLEQTDGAVYEVALAEVAVAAAAVAISSGDVTDARTFNATVADLEGRVTTNEADIAALESDVTGLEATKAELTPSVNAKTGAYTLVLGDRGEFVTCDGTFTITVPGSVFSAGDRVDFVNIGSGTITFAGSGVTLSSKDSKVTIATQYSGATVFFTSASAAILVGDIA